MSGKRFEHSQAADSVKGALSARFASTPARPTPDTTREPTRMVNRSWYLPRDVADALAATAEELRHTVPALSKAEALAALIRAGIEQRDQVAEELNLARSRST